MKTFIIGRRGSPSEWGVFIAPPGVDAETASASQLTLNISNKIDQIILRGTAFGSQSVPLGLTAYAPAVLLFPAGTATFTFQNTDGSFFAAAGYGVSRPMPNVANSASYSASISASAMSLSMSGVVTTLGYLLWNRPAP